MVAAEKGFLELVIEILELDADVSYADQSNKTALHYAIDKEAENMDVVLRLLDKGTRINLQTAGDGYTPLMLAVMRGHVEIARALVQRDCDITLAESQFGNTAVHLACELGERDIVELLVTE